MKNILLVLFLAVTLISCNEQKTAYVDTTVLVQEYSEMKDIEAEFTARSEDLRRELDSAARAFQLEVQAYQEEMGGMSQEERQAAEAELMQKQRMLQQQQQSQSAALRTESDAVVDSVVTKVKDFVEAYGEEHDYTYIFGYIESANIMYAKEGLDITDEILEELNAGTPAEAETELEVEE